MTKEEVTITKVENGYLVKTVESHTQRTLVFSDLTQVLELMLNIFENKFFSEVQVVDKGSLLKI